MKNFKTWGIRIRKDLDRNYYSVWNDLETVRLDLGETIPLNPGKSEFYDVGITERCNSRCQFCYVQADSGKKDYTDICETWKNWISTFPEDKPLDIKNDKILLDILGKLEKENTPEEVLFKFKTMISLRKFGGIYTEKPFQIAIGSTGEPTVHPDLPKFLQTVFETSVVPNYTTNGIILASDTIESEKILEATKNFCGGVAVSFGNKDIRNYARKAISRLIEKGDCKVMIHELIGNKEDVDDFIKLNKEYENQIHYHVLLPLMKHGRSDKAMDNDTYLYLIEKINTQGIKNVAFGANFSPFMKSNTLVPDVWEYPQECYSKNILLKNGKTIITPSSYNLEPLKL